jgi:glycosyltransferase involved in cell wall biosynthesis
VWNMQEARGTEMVATTSTVDCVMQPSLEVSVHYDVSVVVATYNRQHLLARTLDSLVRQDAGTLHYEVLVVDNNSSDDTRAVVARYVERWPHVRYFFEPRPGVSHARNTGISAARAEIVAITDDDVEPDPSWIAAIKRAFDVFVDVDCIGGRITPRWTAPPPSWLTPEMWGPVALQGALQGKQGDNPYVDSNNARRCLATANFACRRAALLEVGGFSPEYLRAVDLELQLRLWRAGKRGVYTSSVSASTEVPIERLAKAYHRKYYLSTGALHARMRRLDTLDREGRLVPAPQDAAKLLGTPGFIYRDLLRHLGGYVSCALALNWRRAFFHETRVLYYVSYVRARRRQEGKRWRDLPQEIGRLAHAVWRKRMGRRLLSHS